MGGSSSSSSSSSSSTHQEDNRVAVEAGGIGIGANAQVTTQVTDFGVLGEAGDTLRAGLTEAARVVLDTNERLAGIVEGNNEVLKEQAESDAKEISQLVIKIMGGFAIISAILIFWRPKK